MPALLVTWGARLSTLLLGAQIGDIFDWFSGDDDSFAERLSAWAFLLILFIPLALFIGLKWDSIKKVFK